MPRNLLLLCVLACAVVYPALCSDDELTQKDNITMGASGDSCEKWGRKCLFEAFCVDGKCQCPDGQKGRAEIGCVYEHEHLCVLFGDPHIQAFGKAISAVPLPCRFRATRFTTDSLDPLYRHMGCSFEVIITNDLIHGRYVAKDVHIAVGVTDAVNQKHTSFHIYKTTNYDVPDTQIYSYQTNTTARHSHWGTGKVDQLDWLNILPDFDSVNNFAILQVPQCGTTIKFRAFDKKAKLYQKLLPGVTIAAPAIATFHDGFGDFPNSVCGTPDDSPSMFEDRAKALGLNDDKTAIIYAILEDAMDQGKNEFKDQCEESFNLFNSSSNKEDDVNACEFILCKLHTTKCIQHTGSYRPIEIFNCCMAFRQGISSSACSAAITATSHCAGISSFA